MVIKNSDVIRHNAETALQSIWPDWKIDILVGGGSYGWVCRICRTLGQSRIYGALKGALCLSSFLFFSFSIILLYPKTTWRVKKGGKAWKRRLSKL